MNELTKGKKASGYAKQMYSTHLKVVEFLKLFNSYQALSPENKSKLSLVKQIEIIQPLASAYSDMIFYFIVKIPITKQESVKKLVNELLKLDETNLTTRICWLGLNRFNKREESSLEFVQSSFKYCKTDRELMVIKYFECVFFLYLGKFESQINISYLNPSYYQEIPDEYKFIFADFTLTSLRTNIGSVIQQVKDMSCLMFDHWNRIALEFINNKSTPKDHPMITHFYFDLAGITIKISKNSDLDNQALDYYNQAIKSKKLILKMLKEENEIIDSNQFIVKSQIESHTNQKL